MYNKADGSEGGEVEATCEHGGLKLAQPLPLAEHQKVEAAIRTGSSKAEQTAG